MRLLFLIFGILFSVFSQTECILNGVEVKPEELGNYKYLVAIQARAKPTASRPEPRTERCGGAILNDRLILTAAHCFAKRNEGDIPDQEYLLVAAHTISSIDPKLTENLMLREISKIYVHAGYFQDDTHHDIAIIQLKSSLNLILNFHKVKAVKLPAADFAIADETAILAGHGINGFDKNNQPIQEKGILKYMDVKASENVPFREQLFRGKPTDESEPRGFCSGDSGAPLVIKSEANFGFTTDYTVIGIVKANDPDCDDRRNGGVYTKVTYYLDSFINKIIANPENIVDELIRVKDVAHVQICSNN